MIAAFFVTANGMAIEMTRSVTEATAASAATLRPMGQSTEGSRQGHGFPPCSSTSGLSHDIRRLQGADERAFVSASTSRIRATWPSPRTVVAEMPRTF